jgi:hypothetical protein
VARIDHNRRKRNVCSRVDDHYEWDDYRSKKSLSDEKISSVAGPAWESAEKTAEPVLQLVQFPKRHWNKRSFHFNALL